MDRTMLMISVAILLVAAAALVLMTQPAAHDDVCGDNICSVTETKQSCPQDCTGGLPVQTLSVSEFNQKVVAGLAPGDYDVIGYVAYKFYVYCPPCPPGAMCAPCQFPYIILSDSRTEKEGYEQGQTLEDGELYLQPTSPLSRDSVDELELLGQYVLTLRKEAGSDPAWVAFEKVPGSGTNLEIHEWGVMAGCPHNATYFATARPEAMMMVKQPIVYVHSNDIDSLDVNVRFAAGQPTDTYPEADVSGGSVTWDNVKVGCGKAAAGLGSKGPVRRLPLDAIIPILDNVDSDCLDYNGQTGNFLFYEGDILFENKVEVTYDVDSQEATFKNDGDNAAYNVILAQQVGDFIGFQVYVALAGDLAPGQEKTVEFKVQDTNNLIIQDMTSLGFTVKETQAFIGLWYDQFFNPTNTGFTNLIYRIPQSQYDELLPATITPTPTKIVRTMYVLVDLSG